LKKIAVAALVGALTVVAIAGFLISTKIDIMAQLSLGRQPVRGVPELSASAITSPPPSMEGINTHPEAIGTGADPSIVTLGPKTGGCPGCPPYPNKNSLDFEVDHGTPVLAPVDMVLIGFNNRNAEYRVRSDGEIQSPYDDLELVFESASPDWPGMVVCVYHLTSSPLLIGHNLDQSCDRVEEWGGTMQAQGRILSAIDEFVIKGVGDPDSCEALMGRLVRRGEVIGYAGSVGDHSMAAFRFKVSHTERNPTVRLGNRHLHWVQPDSFFYWQCYSPDADFPDGVLAYPFPCEGYVLPSEQRDLNFKYVRTEN
jgi:hypothetical protein